MPKIPTRLVKILLVVVVVFVLISAVSGIIQVIYLKRALSSLPNTLFCTIGQSFKSVYGGRFSIFKNLDCSQNYFDNNTSEDTTAPLRRFQQGADFCNRFPNVPACQ